MLKFLCYFTVMWSLPKKIIRDVLKTIDIDKAATAKTKKSTIAQMGALITV